MKFMHTLGLLAAGIALGVVSCSKPATEQMSAEGVSAPSAKSEPAVVEAKPEPPKPREPGTPLAPGDAVTTYALGKLDWVQGEAPTTWEPGKVYVLECWATWCGPCIAAIPHVNDLYKKYQEKGLRVLGINVWEDGKDKVAEFVKQKGDGMSYPVAYTGKGGVFETEWLKPAGVRGIPHAFVVRDGKLLFTTHPSRLTEELVEKLLAGGADADAAVKEIAEASAGASKRESAVNAFAAALKNKDIPAMEKALADVKAVDKQGQFADSFELLLAVKKQDWAATEQLLASEKSIDMGVANAMDDVLGTDTPAAVRAGFISRMEKTVAAGRISPHMLTQLAMLQWKADRKDDAIASAKRSVEMLKDPRLARLPAAPYEKFLAALEAGNLPSVDEIQQWHRAAFEEARKNRPGAPPAPAAPTAPAAPSAPAAQ